MKRLPLIGFCFFFSGLLSAQPTGNSALTQPGIVGTIVLVLIVVLLAILIVVAKVSTLVFNAGKKQEALSEAEFDETLTHLNDAQIARIIERKQQLAFQLEGVELGGKHQSDDKRGVISEVATDVETPLVSEKKKTYAIHEISPQLTRIVKAYLAWAAFWLILGTTVGWYVGIKFIVPEIDNQAWLSFGRLRPVHTNMVFWGWTSLGMLGLGYFVVARTSNRDIFNPRLAWYTLWLINASVIIGSVLLMAGINNGGGEYREYIWPVTALFAVGLAITFYNFYKTVSNRKTAEIYVSNWYMLAASVWALVLVVIGYLPFYQNGLGETVIQGYYMHQGVGMWFMTFTLGLVYYFLPMSVNKPIYSYSLGILALWTQLLFYTLIGTHHYVFSPLPWALQTVAIVFSAGMMVPVIAGTTNFLLTMKGTWRMIQESYVLPFLLVGVVFYFTGSLQGSMQAFRFTNLVWHFTDFNVAHSHVTMYGIIAFFLWGAMYALLPKLTGHEPRQLLVGMHFWFALIGLLAYVISTMVGGTLKGLAWIEGRPFIDSVVLMFPYWLWRAIGGTLMLLAHFIFGYNLWLMLRQRKAPAVAGEFSTQNSILENSETQLAGIKA